MIKKEITYIDLNGVEQKEAFYFHLFTPEAIRLEAKYGEPISTYIARIVSDGNTAAIIALIEEIILGAYGKKTSGGKSFIKTDELRKEFEYSQAYAELFIELLTNPEATKEFAEGLALNKAAPADHLPKLA